MTRPLFGGTDDDRVEAVWQFGQRKVLTLSPGTRVRFYDAEIGGNEVTDLTSDEAGTTPLEAVVTDDQGYLPSFYPPEGYLRLWGEATGSTRRRLVVTQGRQGPPGEPGPPGAPGGSDAAFAGWVADDTSETSAALKATYARRTIINALDHGVVADGSTDDSAAWNALILSLEGTGATVTWTGTSMLDAPISWKKGVSLVGQGWGRSVLATRNTAGDTYFAAIEGFSPYATTASPFEDLLFRDFEVDGSGLAGTSANIQGKAIFMQFLRRCQFVNLYLHDTVGTALGTDFMPDCLIQGVVVVNGGRNWTGVEGGHAGIGIGMGAWEEENVTISDCHTIDCGHWGIFVEQQAEQPYNARGAKIIGCSATGTRGTGIADVGCVNTIISGCSATGNGTDDLVTWRDGIALLFNAQGAMVVNNTVTDNVGDGIRIQSNAGDGNTFRGNKVGRNGRRGIVFGAEGQTRTGYTFADNECWENQYDGMSITATTGSLPNLIVTGNRCYNNAQAGAIGADRGINIGGNVTGGVINSNRCYDDQATKTQQYGIALPSGTFVDTSLVGNNLIGNNTASITTNGATLTSLTRRANIGATSENRGAGTIAAGQATTTIFHGLSSAPTTVQVTPRTNENVWVTTIGAGGFVVNRAVTTNALDFTWVAEI